MLRNRRVYKASQVWGIAPTRAIPGPFPAGGGMGRDRSGNLIFAANFLHQLDKTYNRLRRQKWLQAIDFRRQLGALFGPRALP